MLKNLLHFGEHTVDDVAVPRADIIAIEESASFDELVALFAEAGHSRIPVYRGSLDTIVGMIHIRDAFAILGRGEPPPANLAVRSEEHTSELQSLMRISYAVFCLKKKKKVVPANNS